MGPDGAHTRAPVPAAHHPDADERETAADMAALLTPLSKGWGTDMGVELTGTAIDFVELASYDLEGLTPAAIRRVSAASGLPVTLCSGLPGGLSLASADASCRRQAQDHVRRLIEFALACGALKLSGPIHGDLSQPASAPSGPDDWQRLLDSYAALVLPFTISVFGIFLMRQFFRTVPDDLIHAARLDGMGELEIVWRVMLPTAMPALLAFSIFSVVWHWNDYFWPLLVINSPHLATPPLGTMFFRNEEAGSAFGPLMAGTVLITAPLVLLFVVAQKRFIEGVTLTGVKG